MQRVPRVVLATTGQAVVKGQLQGRVQVRAVMVMVVLVMVMVVAVGLGVLILLHF